MQSSLFKTISLWATMAFLSLAYAQSTVEVWEKPNLRLL